MAEALPGQQRENWGSRSGFVLAAIGSAVGLGNLWGFPYKVYSYGGGAFLIPYVIAMLLIGIPLLIAEFSLGHLTQRATPDAFGRVNRKFAFVGWWQIILSFIIITYYAVILAYCVSFLGYSIHGIFKGSLPWAGEGVEGVKKAKDFFFGDYLNFNKSFTLGRLQFHIVGTLIITWLAMYLCIFRGVKLVSKVVMWTVPLPWLMLLILTIRGLTLEGAVQGLEYYLEPNWGNLADPVTWRWGFGQMFFSMSLAFGIMITYSSFLHRKSDINNNAAIIGLADMGTSFVAGLAVFATLGGMAYASTLAGAAVPVEKVVGGGPGLAFVAFPYALAQLPHAAWFSALFFASLLLLGIDSAFSITESVLASIVDKTGWNRGRTLIGLSVVGLLIGVLFCTQGGLTWLGTFDDFINGTWGITLTALLECFVLGWLFRLRRLRRHANERSDWKTGRWWDWSIRLVIPVILAALFAWSLFDSMKDPNGYALKYKHDEQRIEIPASVALPERPVLELQFMADWNGKVEHTSTLDETKIDKAPDGWFIGSDEPIKSGFKTDGLIGKKLIFKAGALTPGTAYIVRYRWNSRPAIDPKTKLPIPTPTDKQPKWEKLGKIETNSVMTGVNIGNMAGLALMAIAPILAILITSCRFRKQPEWTIQTDYSSEVPHGRGIGIVAVILGLAAMVAIGISFDDMLHGSATLRSNGSDPDPALPMFMVTSIYLPVGAAAAMLALLLGGVAVVLYERKTLKASMAVRLGGGLGVLGLGLAGGLTLAYAVMEKRFVVTPTKYDGELSGVAYLVLGCMLGLIVVGLLWCFYRAIKAAGKAEPEQKPESLE